VVVADLPRGVIRARSAAVLLFLTVLVTIVIIVVFVVVSLLGTGR
jgi:hypothetical protein